MRDEYKDIILLEHRNLAKEETAYFICNKEDEFAFSPPASSISFVFESYSEE